jgi:hypothetical protein
MGAKILFFMKSWSTTMANAFPPPQKGRPVMAVELFTCTYP